MIGLAGSLRVALAAGSLTMLLAGTAFAQDVTLRFGILDIPKNSFGFMNREFPKIVAEKTGGKVKIETFSTLVPPAEFAAAVRDGRLDGAVMIDAYLGGEEPRLNMHDLPGLMRSIDDFKKVYDVYLRGVMTEVWDTRYNATFLTASVGYDVPFFCNCKLETVEDFKGKKLRAATSSTGLFIRELGGETVSISAAEMGVALERGVMDGLSTEYGAALNLGLAENVKGMYEWDIPAITTSSVVINKDKWASIPEDLQKQIREAAAEAEKAYLESYEATNLERRQELLAAGMTFHEASEEEKAKAFAPEHLKAIYDAWYAKAPQGVDARAIAQKVAELLGRKLPD